MESTITSPYVSVGTDRIDQSNKIESANLQSSRNVFTLQISDPLLSPHNLNPLYGDSKTINQDSDIKLST